jgi:2,4-dienoyl-CoA reductase-like NADH-dependent reductase (Old Yellow Enzyme family)
MATLFTPLTIKQVKLKNRLVVSPMCQYSSTDGFGNDWHLVHLGSRAVGGAALVFTEATAVSPEGRISPFDLGIWKDEHIDFLARITDFIKQQDAVPGMQLAHAGRKSSQRPPWENSVPLKPEEGAWQTLAPSAIAYRPGDPVPAELSIAEIERIIGDFKNAAARALKAGFEIIELHGAHGYLINEFLSPLTNQRTDKYGGSFENRTRFLLEIIVQVQTVWPAEFPLFVRISATEFKEGGWNDKDSIELAKVLKTKGIDLIDCSTGGNITGVKIEIRPLYQLSYAENIRREAGIRTGAVGLITTAQEAESIIANAQADLVFMGREFLRDPYFPRRAAWELGEDPEWPNQYERAKKK